MLLPGAAQTLHAEWLTAATYVEPAVCNCELTRWTPAGPPTVALPYEAYRECNKPPVRCRSLRFHGASQSRCVSACRPLTTTEAHCDRTSLLNREAERWTNRGVLKRED